MIFKKGQVEPVVWWALAVFTLVVLSYFIFVIFTDGWSGTVNNIPFWGD